MLSRCPAPPHRVEAARHLGPRRAAKRTTTHAPEDPRPVAPERHITVAFDGACKGNPGPGGYAAILVNNHTQAEEIVRGNEPETTNNRMELRAAIEALN